MEYEWLFAPRATKKHLFEMNNRRLAICGTTKPYEWKMWRSGVERLAELRPCKRCLKTKILIDEIEADRLRSLEKNNLDVLREQSGETRISRKST